MPDAGSPVSDRPVLIVGAGELQQPLIRKVRNRGYSVVAVDGSALAPGLADADEGLVIDTRDIAAVLALATTRDAVAVLSDASDVAVPTVAAVTHALGLPGVPPHIAERFTNKLAMREYARRIGIPVPRFSEANCAADVTEAGATWGWPIVLKPIDGQGSKGVSLVDSPAAVDVAWEAMTAHSRTGRAIIEEFVRGVEFTVEGFKAHDGHISLAASKKEHFPHAPMVANRLVYAPSFTGVPLDVLRDQNDRLVNESGLPFGVTHAEYIFTGDTFVLVEIAARGGGVRISSDIVPDLSGVDPQELLIDAALGTTVSRPDDAWARHCVALDFFTFAPGTVKAVLGLDLVAARDDVIEAIVRAHPGDVIEPPADDTTRHGHFIVRAKDLRDLDRACEEIKGGVAIEYA